MAEQAKITSFEALENFRAALILFLADAHRSVDEVGDAIRQTRQWIQHDQRMHWEGLRRKWQQKLDQATQELMSARLSTLRDSTTMQENAVRKAKAATGRGGQTAALQAQLRQRGRSADEGSKACATSSTTSAEGRQLSPPGAEDPRILRRNARARQRAAAGDRRSSSFRMNTRVSAANLMAAAKELSMEWQETKNYWRDAKTREFEERFLEPLPGYISRATRAMEEVDAILKKVRHDCE